MKPFDLASQDIDEKPREILPLRVKFILWLAPKLGLAVNHQTLPKVLEKPGYAKHLIYMEYYGKHNPIYKLVPTKG